MTSLAHLLVASIGAILLSTAFVGAAVGPAVANGPASVQAVA